jgi:hypothetical protein
LSHHHTLARWRAALTTTALAGALCGGTAAQAQTPAPAQEPARTWLMLQGVHANTKATTRYDGLFSGSGTDVSHESDLQLPRRGTAGTVQFGQRIGNRWRIEVTYEVNRREGSTVLSRSLDLSDNTLAQGTSVFSEARQTVLRVQGGYAFVQTPDSELGVSFGGQSVASRLNVRQTGSGANLTSSNNWDAGLVAALGVFGRQRLGQGDWWLDGRATFGGGDGHYTQANASLVWAANRHLLLGLGYQFTKARLDTELGFVSGISYMHLDYRAHGPLLSLQVGF